LNSPAASEVPEPATELLVAVADAAEQFARDDKAIYAAFYGGTLREWVTEQIPDEYRHDNAGNATTAGLGLDAG
jgi:hypothetical protein